jgi:hypothetical protein
MLGVDLSASEMDLSASEMDLSASEMDLSASEMDLSRREMDLSGKEVHSGGGVVPSQAKVVACVAMGKTNTKSKPSRDKMLPKKVKKSSKSAAAALPNTPPGEDEEGSYRLSTAAQRLGPPDPALEQALREAHPDEILRAEGIKVATDRILADGERLCSKALVHLESKDPEVQQAARRAGLTRPLLALTVDALRRLQGTRDQLEEEQGTRAKKRFVKAVSLETALARGRALKRQTLERLVLVRKADVVLAEAIGRAAERATQPEQLATQLTALSSLVGGLSEHASPTVRTLAAAKALGKDDAEELTQVAELIRLASGQITPRNTRHEEQQAILDVLDGLCLVLLDDVLRALRAMARTTGKIHKPRLHTLAGYFGARGKAEEEPEEPAPIA